MNRDEAVPSGKAAKMLGVSVATIRDWANRGKIKYYKLPNSPQRRFKIKDLQQMLKEMEENYERSKTI